MSFNRSARSVVDRRLRRAALLAACVVPGLIAALAILGGSKALALIASGIGSLLALAIVKVLLEEGVELRGLRERALPAAEERIANQGRQLEGVERRLAEATAALDELTDRIDQLREAQREDRERSDALRAEERNRSILAVTRLKGDAVERGRTLLLLTAHRTGSTMLFDMLRSHPDVDVDPTAQTWTALGLRGRRYPAAFSDVPGATVELEVSPGQAALIPAVERFDGWAGTARSWLVEKAHPQFTEFDAARLLERIEALALDGNTVRIAFGVRDPLEVMWSMAEYKARDGSWYRVVDVADLPAFVLRTYRVVLDVSARLPGPVLDFTAHRSAGPVVELARSLASRPNADVERWHEHACRVTERKDRVEKVPGTFLGDPDPVRPPDGPAGAWADSAPEVAAAREIWKALRARHQPIEL